MPVTVQNVSLLNGHMYALAVIDQNGNKAHANTPFYQTPSGIMLPAPSDALGNPITAAQGIAPTFTQNTGTIASTNTATSFTLALGSLAMGTGLYDARQATVRINNSGTAQTITQVQLVLQDNVGGATIPVTYTVGSLSIASGATDVFTIPLTSGLASTANLIVTFGTAPVAGEVYVSVNFQGAGSGQMSFTGSSATLPYKEIDYIGSFTNPNGSFSLAASATYTAPNAQLGGYQIAQVWAYLGASSTLFVQDPGGYGAFVVPYFSGASTTATSQYPSVLVKPFDNYAVAAVTNTSSTVALTINGLGWRVS